MDTIEKSISEKTKINLHDYLHALSHDPDEYINRLGETISLLRKHRSSEEIIYSLLTQFDLQTNDIDVTIITALETFVCKRRFTLYSSELFLYF